MLRIILVLLLVGCAACSSRSGGEFVVILDQSGGDSVASYLRHPSNYQGRFGSELDPRTSEPFQVIWAARMTERGVVFADWYTPLLRGFDRSGRQRWTAAKKGKGPGEGEQPRDMAVNAKGDILLLHDLGRVTLFSPEGEFTWTHRLVGAPPLAVGPGCDDDWLLYGPAEIGSDAAVPWLRSMVVNGDSVRLNTLWSAPSPSTALPFIDRYQLARVGHHIEFDHPYGRHGGLLAWDCSSRSLVTVASSTYRSRAAVATEVERGKGQVTVAVGFRTDLPYATGRVNIGGKILRTFRLPWDPRLLSPVTYLRLSDGGRTIQARVRGAYSVLDTWEDGRVLIGHEGELTNEAFVVDGPRLVALMVEFAEREAQVVPDDTVFFRLVAPSE